MTKPPQIGISVDIDMDALTAHDNGFLREYELSTGEARDKLLEWIKQDKRPSEKELEEIRRQIKSITQ